MTDNDNTQILNKNVNSAHVTNVGSVTNNNQQPSSSSIHGTFTIMVKNICYNTEKTTLQNLFNACGNIINLNYSYSGRAYITYNSRFEADNAILKSGTNIDGRYITVIIIENNSKQTSLTNITHNNNQIQPYFSINKNCNNQNNNYIQHNRYSFHGSNQNNNYNQHNNNSFHASNQTIELIPTNSIVQPIPTLAVQSIAISTNKPIPISTNQPVIKKRKYDDVNNNSHKDNTLKDQQQNNISSSSSSSSNQPIKTTTTGFKDLIDASMFSIFDLPIDRQGNFSFTAKEFVANLTASPEYDPNNQFLTVELREGYGGPTCKYSRKPADRLQSEFIKIAYSPAMTIKKFGEKIRDYARKTHGDYSKTTYGKEIRWNVLEVCISSYSLV